MLLVHVYVHVCVLIPVHPEDTCSTRVLEYVHVYLWPYMQVGIAILIATDIEIASMLPVATGIAIASMRLSRYR